MIEDQYLIPIVFAKIRLKQALIPFDFNSPGDPFMEGIIVSLTDQEALQFCGNIADIEEEPED